jgi:hypothetical protein
MFHRFAELGTEPWLVRSTEFEYADLDYSKPITFETELAHQASTRFASFIRAVTQSGFVSDNTHAPLERDGDKYVTHLKKSLPPLQYEYTKATVQDNICELDAESLENLPVGLDNGDGHAEVLITEDEVEEGLKLYLAVRSVLVDRP